MSFIEDLDGRTMMCPRFANQGCFKADFVQGSLMNENYQSGFSKGCSMFPLGDRTTECEIFGNLGEVCRGKLKG